MTIVGVGKNLVGSYQVGERLTLETDIVINGKTLAYGYWYQGGLSQYSVIGPEIYASDLGNNLIKVRSDKSYAEIALTEPWACVVAAYALKYRTGLKDGGITWIIGAGGAAPYTISAGFDASSHPTRLLLTDVPAGFTAWLKERATQLGIEVNEVSRIEAAPVEFVDDIVLLGANANLIEQASPHLGQFGVMAILAEKPLERRVNGSITTAGSTWAPQRPMWLRRTKTGR
jgi:D-arabinose 1-dehydrogenase-like Zn-dependent alcohol dehydrogenase